MGNETRRSGGSTVVVATLAGLILSGGFMLNCAHASGCARPTRRLYCAYRARD